MKFLRFVFVAVCMISAGHAQNINIYTERTEVNPGFFAMSLELGELGNPVDLPTFFVKNYAKSDLKKYQNVWPEINTIGGRVIEKDQVALFRNKGRVIYLGESAEGFAVFAPKTKNESHIEFQNFWSQYEKAVYMYNVQVETGGNISDMQFPFPREVGEDGVTIFGKFDQPIQTHVKITGMTTEGEVLYEGPLDFENMEISPIAGQLPMFWEEAKQALNPSNYSGSKLANGFIKLFPWIMLLLGAWFLYLAFRSRSQYASDEFLKNAPKNEAGYINAEKLEKKESEKYEIYDEIPHQKIDNPWNDIPFTVEESDRS